MFAANTGAVFDVNRNRAEESPGLREPYALGEEGGRRSFPAMNVAAIYLILISLWVPDFAIADKGAHGSCRGPGDTVCKVRSWDRKKREVKLLLLGTFQDRFDVGVQPHEGAPYTLPVDFSSSGSLRDCTATLTCPDGRFLECAASGPKTSCSNNETTVGCFVLDEWGNSVSGSSASCS